MRKGTKIWLIIAALLVLVGCIVFSAAMTAIKWDFTKLSTAKYETSDYEISEGYKNISVVTDTCDIVFAPSESRVTTVTCREQKNAKHSVTVKDDTLVIEIVDERKWYDFIGISFGSPKITVYLPQGEYGRLSARAITGSICVEKMTAGSLDLSVTTGKITVSDVVCEGDVKVSSTTGRTALTGLYCKNVISDGSTGDLSLNSVIAAQKISVERSTGDISFNSSDAAEIVAKTATGNITGTLLSAKEFIASSDTGRVDVTKSSNGGRCKLTTDTGNICVKIKKED